MPKLSRNKACISVNFDQDVGSLAGQNGRQPGALGVTVQGHLRGGKMAEMVAKLEDVLHRLFGNVRNQERVGVGSFKLSLPSQTLNSFVK